MRALLRRLMLWLWPELGSIVSMRRMVASTRDAVDVVQHEQDLLHARWLQQQQVQTELGKMTCWHERDIAFLKAREATGASYAALDRRLARIELMLHAPISDGVCEVDQAVEAAMRAVKGDA